MRRTCISCPGDRWPQCKRTSPVTGQMCWTQILTLAPMYSVRSLQCFTRLPGSLVSSVLLSIPTSLDVLVVLTTIIFNLRKCSLTTPGGANKASLIQYSRQAPKTTKDVKLTNIMRKKRLMMTHSQSTRGRWTLKRYISSSPWQAWEREAKCYIFLRSPTYPGVDDACLLGGPHEQGVED